ncbi:putative aminopeptidase y protein [Eutypa lata UCREL1]|uniref:Peptide hydrolase n=1 Tax=Eutypa lata (strain UCR-EL1) TaxID=1287681 RepID=M7S6S9_EUTLA|nr:putative aminopeptidase y protein [Eutypa lata UCREL1]
MKTASSALAVAMLALTGNAEPIRRSSCGLPLVQDEALVDAVVIDDLLQCAQDLEDIAYATPYRNRVHGSEGHHNSVQYFVDQLKSLGDYYNVELQEFSTEATLASANTLSVNGEAIEAEILSFSNNGTWSDVSLVPVANLGCNPEDFPETVSGSTALIERGNCTFALKAQLATEKGAIAAIVFNNAEVGVTAGTMGGVNEFVATAGISRADGLRFVEEYNAGTAIASDGEFWAYVDSNATSYNVVASSKFGDPDNVLFLGAHSDSVEKGPGINDNGSGSCGILTVAKALAKYRTNNQVRFAWWTAEEEGLLGAEHYTNITSTTALDKIRLYLNFDMIASPNYVLGIYDGDGSAFNLSGPAGSAEAEALFEDYYASKDLPFTASEFNGRSDYGPFLDHGVPCGGLDTGADGIKTEEEAALFGGIAGETYDQNYHSAKDNVTNLDLGAFEITGKAMAHAVAVYGTSWEGFPTRNTTLAARSRIPGIFPPKASYSHSTKSSTRRSKQRF